MVVKTVEISQDQQNFIKSACINFSSFVRKHIDDEMEMRKDD